MRRPLTVAPATVATVGALLVLAAGCSDDPAATAAPTTTAPAILASKLATPWACGYGFRMSDADQTMALVIEWSADFRTGDPADVIAPEGPLVGGDWHASVELGRDLFANWCDDVIEPGEPEPVVDATLEVVAGTLTLVGDLPAGGPAAAHLTGVVAQRADGSTVELDDLDVSNPCWGCAAG